MPRYFRPPPPIRTGLLLALVAATLWTIACRGGQDAARKKPQFYPPPAMSHCEDAFCGTGIAPAPSRKAALDTARTRARGDLAASIAAQFQEFTNQLRTELRAAESRSGPPTALQHSSFLDQFEEAQTRAIQQIIDTTTATQKRITDTDDGYRAAVLMAVPTRAAARALMSALRQHEAFYTRFRTTQTFEALRKAAGPRPPNSDERP